MIGTVLTFGPSIVKDISKLLFPQTFPDSPFSSPLSELLTTPVNDSCTKVYEYQYRVANQEIGFRSRYRVSQQKACLVNTGGGKRGRKLGNKNIDEGARKRDLHPRTVCSPLLC